MKLQSFFEYVDNIDSKSYIPFNKNEIKYILDKGVLFTEYQQQYVYYREVRKLSDGNYIVVHPQIECTTIQSLLKYTEDSIKEVSDYLINKFKESTIQEFYGYKSWYYEGREWAYQKLQSSLSFIDICHDDAIDICEKYNLMHNELELLINEKIKKYL